MDESVLTSGVPLTRWQALRERLALVWGKASDWWGVDGSGVFWKLFGIASLGILAAAFLSFWMGASSREASQDAEPHAVVAPDVSPVSGDPVLNVEPILMDMDRRLVELEVRAGLPARVAYVAPAFPSAAGRSDVPWLPAPASLPVSPVAPAAPAVPAGAWGETDLDRSLSNFTPPDTFGALK